MKRPSFSPILRRPVHTHEHPTRHGKRTWTYAAAAPASPVDSRAAFLPPSAARSTPAEFPFPTFCRSQETARTGRALPPTLTTLLALLISPHRLSPSCPPTAWRGAANRFSRLQRATRVRSEAERFPPVWSPCVQREGCAQVEVAMASNESERHVETDPSNRYFRVSLTVFYSCVAIVRFYAL